MSIARQCDLIGLPRSTYYYQAQGESAENLTWMRLLDQQYTDTPYYGVRRMTAWLRSQGYHVNHKRVAAASGTGLSDASVGVFRFVRIVVYLN